MGKINKVSRTDGFITGTSFHGHTILTTVNELTTEFGEPNCIDDGKVMYEWPLEFENEDGDMIQFYIYDWKEGNPSRSRRLHFHIGAKNEAESREAMIRVELQMK